jgi:hypothetical protein
MDRRDAQPGRISPAPIRNVGAPIMIAALQGFSGRNALEIGQDTSERITGWKDEVCVEAILSTRLSSLAVFVEFKAD